MWWRSPFGSADTEAFPARWVSRVYSGAHPEHILHNGPLKIQYYCTFGSSSEPAVPDRQQVQADCHLYCFLRLGNRSSVPDRPTPAAQGLSAARSSATGCLGRMDVMWWGEFHFWMHLCQILIFLYFPFSHRCFKLSSGKRETHLW